MKDQKDSENSVPKDTKQVAPQGSELGTPTLFMCGPSKCDHDWSKEEPIIENGREVGSTVACAKCGRTAYEEAAWL